MEATEKNYELSEKIIALLSKENCTIKQAEEILSFVGTTIRRTSTVQLCEGLVEMFNCGKNL